MSRPGMDVALLGCDNSRWDIHNTRTPALHGQQGVVIREAGLDALETPVETEWDETAGGIGATQVGPPRYKAADMQLGLIAADRRARRSLDPGQLDSEIRQAFAYGDDPWDPGFRHARIRIMTELSGQRERTVTARETTKMDFDLDPLSRQVLLSIMQLRAADPRWYSKPVTTFFQSSSTSASGFIEVSNPTPLPMALTVKLTRAKWTLPDPSWEGRKGHRAPGGEFASRTLPLPLITAADGGVTIRQDTARHLHAQTFAKTNFQVRMKGNWLRHVIPPWTPKTLLPISYTNAPGVGARAEYLQVRGWPMPWGGEL